MDLWTTTPKWTKGSQWRKEQTRWLVWTLWWSFRKISFIFIAPEMVFWNSSQFFSVFATFLALLCGKLQFKKTDSVSFKTDENGIGRNWIPLELLRANIETMSNWENSANGIIYQSSVFPGDVNLHKGRFSNIASIKINREP